MADWKIYLAVIIYWGNSISVYGFSFAAPTIIRELGYTSAQAQLLTIPIYFFGACSTIFFARLADRRKTRWAFIVIPFSIALVGYVGVLSITHPGLPGLTYFFPFFITGGLYPSIIGRISWVGNNLAPSFKRAIGMALLMIVGNLGGAVGSNIFLEDQAPQYWLGYGLSAGIIVAAISSTVILQLSLKYINAKRAEMSEVDGADIVLRGRVADASPTIGIAAYHYGWIRTSYEELAGAFVAGHFIECSTYVTGGNFSGFKSLPGKVTNLGFPIIEMASNGHFIVTKQEGRDGMVTVDTCKAQLLYEIQGPLYYNSDVVARLDGIEIRQHGKDRVLVTGIKGIKPPPTTKVGITAKGGYQAEGHYFLVGLDIEEKADMVETQTRVASAATVDLRIFAQARNEEDLALGKFFRPVSDVIMQSYPGATFGVDARQAQPKPYYEYWVSLLPQASISHVVHLPSKGLEFLVPPPSDTKAFVRDQDTYETSNPVDVGSFGPTTRAPLGYIVHARSGDKGSDCNVGFFVRQADEWDWLRSVLTVDKVRELLGDDDTGKPSSASNCPIFAVSSWSPFGSTPH
ncbi:hypothetical protein BN1723_017517 [Verticillium longisporum]|uniref:Major facilitator superfamily (MFS) profile domain-containing protein n=1 Tax=Verticillium longisporum TaxID=100787 RepID=A0A0G4L536_VERLO|nr:hypothetical protein BN1723_017517 [Verticillium longisporum]